MACGDALGVDQKLQGDDPRAGVRNGRSPLSKLGMSAAGRRVSSKYMYVCHLMPKTGSFILYRREGDLLYHGCSAPWQQRSRVQQPGSIASADGSLSMSDQLCIHIFSAALAGRGPSQRCAARCFTFCTERQKRSELLAEHARSTNRRAYQSLIPL